MAASPGYQQALVSQTTRTKQGLVVDKWSGTGDPNQAVESFVATGQIVSTSAGTQVVLTVVNGAGTAVPLDAAFVGPGRTLRIIGLRGVVSSTVAWATTLTILSIKDTADNVVITFPIAALTSKAVIGLNTASVVLGAAILTGNGRVAAGNGLYVVGDANAGSGSPINFLVHGQIEPT